MIRINKGKEPIEWTEKKSTPDFTIYEPIDSLRTQLLIEQGYICAYCMRRIPAKDKTVNASSKIEHIKSQADRPDLQLEYSNMAVCCPGKLNSESHCDTSKGNKSVTFDLHNSTLQQSISYSSKDGDIKSSNTQWNQEINSILNLNHSLLKANRKEVLNALMKYLATNNWNAQTIRSQHRLWSQPNKNGNMFPFCGIVIWYLEKKLKQF